MFLSISSQVAPLSRSLTKTFKQAGNCRKLSKLIYYAFSLAESLTERNFSKHTTLFKHGVVVLTLPKLVFQDIGSVRAKVVKNCDKSEEFFSLIYAVLDLFQSFVIVRKNIFFLSGSFSKQMQIAGIVNHSIQLVQDAGKLRAFQNMRELVECGTKTAANILTIGLDILKVAGVAHPFLRNGLPVCFLSLKIIAEVARNYGS